MSDRISQLKEVQREALELFSKKNVDYGDAFANYGPIGVLVRIGDKLSRLQTISNTGVTLVNDEKLRDSLIDLHNYSAMAIMLLDEDTVPDLYIDEEMLKDVMYGDAACSRSGLMKLNEVTHSVCNIVCGGRLDLETCKTLVAAVMDTYIEREVAARYLAVALRMAYEGEDILSLDAAIRARESLNDNDSNIINSNESIENILVSEAGVGVVTDNEYQ
tara:strand:- start:708 stop:1361 length:654 start_codon:yes stop_codon:yes gene_type:complete